MDISALIGAESDLHEGTGQERGGGRVGGTASWWSRVFRVGAATEKRIVELEQSLIGGEVVRRDSRLRIGM